MENSSELNYIDPDDNYYNDIFSNADRFSEPAPDSENLYNLDTNPSSDINTNRSSYTSVGQYCDILKDVQIF